MRPLTAATLVAVAGIAAWALAAPSEKDGRPARGRFLDTLSPGDRIEIPQEFARPGASPARDDGASIFVLSEERARERSMPPEEMKELAALRKQADGNATLTEPLRQRLAELGSKASLHPSTVVEVGEDYVAYRGGSGGVTFLPERRITSIYRSSRDRGTAADAASR